MKFSFLLIAILILSFGHTKIDTDDNSVVQKESYKVYKIDSINSYYLIYAKKNDSLFKIVSKKEKLENCQRIQIDSCYNFKLYTSFDNPPMIGNTIILPQNYLDVPCFVFDDSTSICIESNNAINYLSYAKNLLGLCFTEK